MHRHISLLRTVSVPYYARYLFLTMHGVCFLLCTVCVSYYARYLFLTMHDVCFLPRKKTTFRDNILQGDSSYLVNQVIVCEDYESDLY